MIWVKVAFWGVASLPLFIIIYFWIEFAAYLKDMLAALPQ